MSDRREDLAEHVRTYDLFVRMTMIGALHVAAILIAIVIATLEGWLWLGAIGMVAATLAAFYGLVRSGRGAAMPLLAVLILLAFFMAVLA